MSNTTKQPDPIPGTDLAAYHAWQAHIDAGRIGNRAPADPAIRANTLRTEHILHRARHAARHTGAAA